MARRRPVEGVRRPIAIAVGALMLAAACNPDSDTVSTADPPQADDATTTSEAAATPGTSSPTPSPSGLGCLADRADDHPVAMSALASLEQLVAELDRVRPPDGSGYEYFGLSPVEYDPQPLATSLGETDVTDQLASVGAAAPCEDEVLARIELTRRMAPVVAADPSPAYCAHLDGWFGAGDPDAPLASVPVSHQRVHDELAAADPYTVAPDLAAKIGPELLGMGLYAETRCSSGQATFVAYGLYLMFEQAARPAPPGAESVDGALCADSETGAVYDWTSYVGEDLQVGAEAATVHSLLLASYAKDMEPDAIDADPLVDALDVDGAAENIRSLGAAVGYACSWTPTGANPLEPLAAMAELLDAEPTAAYCEGLGSMLESGRDGWDGIPDAPPADGAPEAHRSALESMRAGPPTDPTTGSVDPSHPGAPWYATHLVALGLYAEARCDVPQGWALAFSFTLSG